MSTTAGMPTRRAPGDGSDAAAPADRGSRRLAVPRARAGAVAGAVSSTVSSAVAGPPQTSTGLRRLLGVAFAVALALGCLARLRSDSALWLDEALSLEIATRPLPDLLDALRRDGSPPLYYLLLGGWTAVLGDTPTTARALSAVLSLATLPVVWLCARRLGGTRPRLTAWSAVLLLAVSPFAVRYATEVRMYALVQLLSAAGLLAVLRALERPSAGRLVPVALLSGALALTHYWALFLLAVAGLVLLVLSVRGTARGTPRASGGARAGTAAARRVLLALAAGGVLFLPWLPSFLFQLAHTGTPWAAPPQSADVFRTLSSWTGGGTGAGQSLALLLVALAGLALAGHPARGGVLVGRPLDRTALVLLTASLGTLVLGLALGVLVSAGYAARYSSVALVPALLLAARGVGVLPPRARVGALGLVALLGLAGVLPQPFSTGRTQAARTAAVIERALLPGDVVVYCPDQLGPAVSRLLPAGTDQVVYPTAGSPALVDWVDYAARNASASPGGFARRMDARAEGAVWLVSAEGYRTFGRQCERLAEELEQLRGPARLVQQRSGAYEEQQQVLRFRSAPPS